MLTPPEDRKKETADSQSKTRIRFDPTRKPVSSTENRNQFRIRVWMGANKTMKNRTKKAEGSIDYSIFNKEIDEITRMTQIVSDPYSHETYADLNYADDHQDLPSYDLLDKFEIQCNTRGNQAGPTTVIVSFDPVTLLQEA